jgi:hypothetical protein
MLKMGQVVVTEVNRHNVLSRAISHCTRSVVTHAFLSTGGDYAIEAAFPKVRVISVEERLAHLRANDQAYAVLDLPGITVGKRYLVGTKAHEYVGHNYDVGQALLYAFTNKFWNDGTGTLLCSRLVTASYLSGAKIDLFPEELLAQKYDDSNPRLDNLRAGYAVPADLLHSKLEVVDFVPSSHSQSLDAFLKSQNAR